MSSTVSFFVIAGTVLSLVGFFLILHLNRTVGTPGNTTGHNYDGIEEYDNPLPAWWYWMFLLSIIFAVGYLAYYPGLGNFKGFGQWSSVTELERDEARAQEIYGPIFAQYRDKSLDELAAIPEANKMGQRLFANNCSVCHGATAQGSFGFPNLTDEEWIWGSDDSAITSSIRQGRQAAMPGWDAVLGDEGVMEVSEYVLQLAGREVDQERAAKGVAHYTTFCAVCHGADGKGQAIFGAPNLTNEIWLYGNSRSRIQHIVRHGRNGQMPGFEAKLGADKVHILAGYVRSLQPAAPASRMSTPPQTRVKEAAPAPKPALDPAIDQTIDQAIDQAIDQVPAQTEDAGILDAPEPEVSQRENSPVTHGR